MRHGRIRTDTARYLQHLGFRALATTSSGAAFSMGFPDADWALTRDPMLAHIRTIVEASDLPVSADFESGYADDPASVAENVRLCVETGVAGLSIEDSTGDPPKPLYEFDPAVARIRAVRAAIDRTSGDVLLVGRTEGFIAGVPVLDERSGGSKLMPRPVPTASTPRASERTSRSQRSSTPSLRSRSTC